MTRKHRRGKRIFQDSPFLEIPGEIRMMIYEAALIKPTSIDLWPHSYVEKPEDNPALAARIAKASEENAARQGRDNNRNIYRDPKFRRQDDLLYVRKEMAIGLLATCKQICHEATPIFWCKNTFRFSSDSNWLGVRRFLQTIGPNAIRRLRTLEVFVPLVYTPWTVTPDQEIEAFRDAKNFPKLHMAKVGLGVKGDNELYENMEMVTFLLTEAMATLELHLVLPRGFALNQQGVTSGLEPVIYFPEELQLKRPFTKVTLIIEPGAYVCGMGVPESVADNGVDYVCMPGSFWKKRIDTSEEEAKVLAVKKWKRTSEELEMLDGLQELMKENESIGVPGNGGRANKSPGLKKVERVLKGFGGCRFTRRIGFDCDGCGKTIFDPRSSSLFGYRSFSIGGRCDTCMRWRYHESRFVVEVKKKTRASRLGVIG